MGCTSSKIARKRAAREGWYAPLSRSASAPFHYPAESEGDSCHVVSLTSSSYGILKMERPGDQGDPGSFVRLSRARLLAEEEDEFVFSHAKQTIVKTKQNPVKEENEEQEEDGDLETINTWELMEGLDDAGRTPSPLRACGKSVSFSRVQELDSCFSETGSPIWRKYFAQEELEKGKQHRHGDSSPITPPPRAALHSPLLRSIPHSSLHETADATCISPIEPLDGSYSLNSLHSPSKSPAGLTSPFRNDVSPHRTSLSLDGDSELCHPGFHGGCDLKSPEKSPDLSGRATNSKGSASPLFDATLMATFEQALTAMTATEDDWLLLNADGSTTNSSSSSENSTMASSDTSSDSESTQVQRLRGMEGKKESLRKMKISPSKVLPVDMEEEAVLDRFEQICPPRGEGKVVLYFTSLRGVRKTYEECCDLRLILQGLGVRVDERDVWMHSKFREELTEVLGSKRLPVPRLFIKGRYIGGAEEVKQLHEDGLLARLIEGLPTDLFRRVCDGCGDARFVPCLTCRGSCKVLDEYDEASRCPHCNENGLIMCPICSN